MEQSSLEQIVRQHVKLGTANSNGWHPCVHVGGCDRGHKGPRAAFNFSNQTVAFHCFNCGTSTVYDPHYHETMPEKMASILSDFGIFEDQWRPIVFEHFGKQSGERRSYQQQIQDIEPTKIDIPKPFFFLDTAYDTNKWAQVAKHYLQNVRNINPDDYPFMLCGPDSDRKKWDKWQRRLIIPIFRGNHLVFYQGRALSDNVQPKYLSPPIPKDKVLYGYEQILHHKDNEQPLYVVEGWFDAFKLGDNSVALLGNEISNEQVQWLNRTNRQKIYIPDRFGNGRQAAEHALRLGWHVSTPAIGDCKDIADAVDHHGLLYVLKSIADNATNDYFEAHTQLGFFCN